MAGDAWVGRTRSGWPAGPESTALPSYLSASIGFYVDILTEGVSLFIWHTASRPRPASVPWERPVAVLGVGVAM
ncbi:hypothetical protein DEQ16_10770 [Dietzia maris]|nr:hypothetical protein DEQ16_10770 [Dietzia maris]